jgi:hypothetical protein
MNSPTQKRDRGLILTPEGRQKLQAAIDRLGVSQKYVIGKIVEKIQLNKDTLHRDTVDNIVEGRKASKSSLKVVFEALKLNLDQGDYVVARANQPADSNESETSPFITGNPITHPRCFFGREKELKRLFNLSKRLPLQNAAIIGKKRSGIAVLGKMRYHVTDTN